MKPDEIRECFDYLIESRERLLSTLRQIGWDEFGKDRGATWGSMMLVFLHILDDEEGWLQFAARGRSILDGPDRKPSQYAGFDDLAADDRSVGAATRDFLGGLSDADLRRVVEIPHGPGKDLRTVEKVVMHTFIDELAHVGELVCLLWQLGVEPPFIDWLDYHESHNH
jgi:uncharacterized damage-inducible protein DinB